MKKAIKEYLLQLVLIVFSVVLGLYLSERLEERKLKKESANLLSKIGLELDQNKALLHQWVPYHGQVVNNLDSMMRDDAFITELIKDKSAIYPAFSRGTIMSDMPAADAWDIAKAHPLLVHVDYDILLGLSRVYN